LQFIDCDYFSSMWVFIFIWAREKKEKKSIGISEYISYYLLILWNINMRDAGFSSYFINIDDDFKTVKCAIYE
jgi:hypothetical protein